MKLRYPLILALLAALFLAACSAGPPEVKSPTLTRAMDADYKPTDPTSSFKKTEPVMLSVNVVNMEKGAKVGANFYYRTVLLDNLEVTLDDGGSGFVGFTLKPDDLGWFGGDGYRIEVLLNGTKQTEVTYTVDASAPNPRVTALTLARGLDRNQRPQDETVEFTPEETLYASVTVADLLKGQKVTAKWFKGSEELESTDLTLDDGLFIFEQVLGFTLKPTGAFEPGDYRLDVLIDNKLSRSQRFSVSEPQAVFVSSQMSSGVNSADGSPIDETTVFAPDQIVFYVAQFNPFPQGTTLEGRWFKGDTELASTEYVEENGFDESIFFRFTYTPNADSPMEPGDDYRIEVYQAGQKIDELSFSVSAPGPFGDVTFAADVTVDSEPVGADAVFPYGTTVVYATFPFDGIEDGTEWSWIWTRTGADPLESDPQIWDLGSSGISWVNISNPDGITPGEYTLELQIGGSAVRVGTMTVQDSNQGDYADVPSDFVTTSESGISVAHPSDWTVSNSGGTITLRDPSNSVFVVAGLANDDGTSIDDAVQRFVEGFQADEGTFNDVKQMVPSVQLVGLESEWRGFTVERKGVLFRGSFGLSRSGSSVYLFLSLYQVNDDGVAANRVAWTIASSMSR